MSSSVIVKRHYVFGTGASFSHVPPVINLCLSLLSFASDLTITVILHENNVEYTLKTISSHHEIEDVGERSKLRSVGEKTAMKDTVGPYMAMVYGSGPAYGQILGTSMADPTAPPIPDAFIFDITSFFYTQVKTAVEANFPGNKSPRLIAYNPIPIAEMILHAAELENKGSLRWVYNALKAHNVDSVEVQFEELVASVKPFDASQPAPPTSPELKMKIIGVIKSFREVVTESDRTIHIAGYEPFRKSIPTYSRLTLLDLYERWSTEADWKGADLGWFQYLFGLQAAALAAERFIGIFPSSVLESTTLENANLDPIIGKNGGYKELGWFEVEAKADWGKGVKEFLGTHSPKSVVYISFGTLFDAGEAALHLFEYLLTKNIPFLYACGNQKAHLPQTLIDFLDEAEKGGKALVTDWCDQVGVLSHPSIMTFVSHCGANSVMESILAGVPILAWPRHYDQPILAMQVHSLKLGINLLQHRSGYIVGKTLYSRPDETILSTKEALEVELDQALAQIQGSAGKEMRENCKKMAEEIREKRKGEWQDAVKSFALSCE